MLNTTEVFIRQLADWGLSVDVEARKQLVGYANMLAGYDKANVIGTKDRDEILLGHILDSLSCLIFVPLRAASRVADIGSGGGLPGIPVAMMLPGADVTLFESVGKKAEFLNHASEELSLGNVRVVNSRIEDAARDAEHRGVFDVCTARALARLSVISEYSLPLLRRGGHVIAMKARKDADEMAEGGRAAALLGGRLIEEIRVPQTSVVERKERRLVVLEKFGATPERYPRRTGMPAKAPLGTEK